MIIQIMPFPSATAIIQPDEISGLALWLDPTTITGKSHGDTVTSWADSSGNGRNATEATNPPTYDDGTGNYEGVPGVRFDALAERLTVASSAGLSNNQATYIVVARLESYEVDLSTSNSCWLFNKYNTNPATAAIRLHGQGYQSLYRIEGSEGTAYIQDTDAYVDQTVSMHILRASASRVRYDVATAAGALDGAYTPVQNDVIAGGLDDDNHNTLVIGNHPTTNNTTNVPRTIYDVLVYNRSLTDEEVQNLGLWFRDKYQSKWVKLGQQFSGANHYSVNIFIDGTTAYLTYVKSDNVSIGYMTADISDPLNWTDQGTIFTTSSNARTARLVKDGSTWYLFYDDRPNGTLRVATGASIGALSDYGSNPILSGTGTDWEQYVRHGFVLTPDETHDGDWHMLYDGRKGTSVSGVGAVGHATSSDGLSWTRDAANNPVISPVGGTQWEGNDCGEPRAYWDGSQYRVFWAGYLVDWTETGTTLYPHLLGEGTSSDLGSVTRSNANPILPVSQYDGTHFDTVSLLSPCPYVPGDGNFYLYYTGFDSGINFGIGLARER